MNIVVLAGGLSPERDVSLSSGSMIANALIEKGHKVLLVDVYEGVKELELQLGDMFFGKESGKIFSYDIEETDPNLAEVKRRNGNQKALIGKNVIELCTFADSVFLALHGAMGENGQLQATLDNFGIKYTGSGYIGSLLAMDKDLSKTLIRDAGIKTAEWILYNFEKDVPDRIYAEVGLPCVVKPCSCGSSVGVSIVHDHDELVSALEFAREYEENLIIEKYVAGREFSVGILGGEALPVIEIIPLQGFYDYKNKYQSGMTKEVCPAELSTELTKEVQRLAKQVHRILRLGDYSRIDFILDAAGSYTCLEANTLPGMTPVSLLPQEAAARGMSYPELCEKLVLLSLS